MTIFLAKDIDDAIGSWVGSMKTKEGKNAMLIVNLVYNPDTLHLELMKQPIVEVGGDLTVSMGDVEKLLAGNYFLRVKTDISDPMVIYTGYHTSAAAADGDSGWLVVKESISASLIDKQGPLSGTWTNRTSLGW